jgi:Fe2+ or Zn2+ uptake regulation protein
MAILDQLFSSRTRVKLLSIFLKNPDEEYFVRELTRLLDEQINSIRRELENLKTTGLIKSKNKARKKYFCINKSHVIFEDLKNVFEKTSSANSELVNDLRKIGSLKILLTSGFYTGIKASVDLLIVGDFDRENLANYIKSLENKTNRSIMYTSITADDFVFRKKIKDAFLEQILNQKHNILYNALESEI